MKRTKETSERFTIGDIYEGWHLLNNPYLSVIHEKMSPHSEEEPHHHMKTQQFFFVLKGSVICEVDGVKHQLNEMEGIEVPPLSTHRMINENAEIAEFLTISQPHYRNEKK